MSENKFNFNLGNRSLTAEELTVVENAKRLFRDSLARHSPGRLIEGHAIFKSRSNFTATHTVPRPLGTDVVADDVPEKARGTDVIGSSSWSTNKIPPASRKY
jgi:hypothetical protein